MKILLSRLHQWTAASAFFAASLACSADPFFQLGLWVLTCRSSTTSDRSAASDSIRGTAAMPGCRV